MDDVLGRQPRYPASAEYQNGLCGQTITLTQARPMTSNVVSSRYCT